MFFFSKLVCFFWGAQGEPLGRGLYGSFKGLLGVHTFFFFSLFVFVYGGARGKLLEGAFNGLLKAF